MDNTSVQSNDDHQTELMKNYRDCGKAKETRSDTGMHNRAITVLHEQWMCPGMQRHTQITPCSMVTI